MSDLKDRVLTEITIGKLFADAGITEDREQQQRALSAVLQGDKRNVAYLGGRKCGKTSVGIVKAIVDAFNGRSVLYTTSSGGEAYESYEKAQMVLRRAGITHDAKKYGEIGNIIELGEGGIRFVTRGHKNNGNIGRGGRYDLIIIDDAELLHREQFRSLSMSHYASGTDMVLLGELSDEAPENIFFKDLLFSLMAHEDTSFINDFEVF